MKKFIITILILGTAWIRLLAQQSAPNYMFPDTSGVFKENRYAGDYIGVRSLPKYRFSLNTNVTKGVTIGSVLLAGKCDTVGSSSANVTIDGGSITSEPSIGFNPGSGLSVMDWINQCYYASQSPIAALSGGYNLELCESGTIINASLTWSAARQSATTELESIVITGMSNTYNQSFIQPSTPGTVSGSQNVTLTINTTNVYTNTVTTVDDKTDDATTTFNFYPNRYWGFVSSTSPTDNTIHNLSQYWCTTRTQSTTSALTPSGSQYYCIAFPYSFDTGNTSQIWISGLDQTGTFTRTTRTLVNESGYSQTYIIYVSNNPTTGSIYHEIK